MSPIDPRRRWRIGMWLGGTILAAAGIAVIAGPLVAMTAALESIELPHASTPLELAGGMPSPKTIVLAALGAGAIGGAILVFSAIRLGRAEIEAERGDPLRWS